MLGHPHSAKSVFSSSEGTPLCVRLCPSHLVQSLGMTGKRPAPCSVCPLFKYLFMLVISPPEPSVLLAEQSLGSFLLYEVLPSLRYPCGPLLVSLQYVHVVLSLRNPDLQSGSRSPWDHCWPGSYQCWESSLLLCLGWSASQYCWGFFPHSFLWLFVVGLFVCLVCNHPVVLSRGLHWALLLRGSFMEKVAMCVKDKEEGQCFQPVLPMDLLGRSEGICYQILPLTKLQAAGSGRG